MLILIYQLYCWCKGQLKYKHAPDRTIVLMVKNTTSECKPVEVIEKYSLPINEKCTKEWNLQVYGPLQCEYVNPCLAKHVGYNVISDCESKEGYIEVYSDKMPEPNSSGCIKSINCKYGEELDTLMEKLKKLLPE